MNCNTTHYRANSSSVPGDPTEEFTPAIEQRIKANIQKLVAFTNALEQHCGISGRVLWSEGEDNLAQKLIAKLQKVQ